MSGRAGAAAAVTYNASEHLLVVARTHRPDVLNNFKLYSGGWNLSSMSYFASAGFVGMPLFVISLIWIFMGFTFMIVVTCMYFCWKDHLKSEPDFGRFGNYTTLVLVIAFTVITISGCGALFTGQEELHTDLSQVFNYLTTQVAQAANDSVQSVPPTAVPDATHAAEVLENATSSISVTVHQTLDQICFWLIVLGSCVLAVSLLGLAFVLCRVQAIVYMFVAIGWLGVIGLWFLGGIFILVYAVFGDTCAAIDEWTANPRNGTAFDIIVRCELNHTKPPPRGRRHTSMGEVLPARDEDEIVFPEYKPLSDLSLHLHLHLPALPPLPKFKSPKDTTGEEETPFPEYKTSIKDKSSKDTTDDEEETPFPEYTSLNDENFKWNDDDDDDPNDASPQKREFWAELAVQQNEAALENESCTILRAAFVPILDNISRYNCPGILRNTLWVTLAVVTLSGGCMFSICLWIVITRRSTMRWRKMVPAVDDQLPFYAYVFQDLSAAVPMPVPMPKKKNNNNQYVEYRNSNVGAGNAGGGGGANPNYNARARRAGHVYDNPAEMARSAYAERRRRENNRR